MRSKVNIAVSYSEQKPMQNKLRLIGGGGLGGGGVRGFTDLHVFKPATNQIFNIHVQQVGNDFIYVFLATSYLYVTPYN